MKINHIIRKIILIGNPRNKLDFYYKAYIIDKILKKQINHNKLNNILKESNGS